ncbi:MAG: metalloregulator ArsR/SmtB family transcription factor [Gammaproteobacteria bacterium]|nr:metalloregulator ArsR/SmtB family transcription factor [Gammaproteobacteria bacterium]
MNITLASLFQLLSDETRLRSLVLMQQHGELCVCELMQVMQLVQPKISRHLALLRDASLVTDRRQGQWIYYQLNPELPLWLKQIIETASQQSALETAFAQDEKNMQLMLNRAKQNICTTA